MVELARYHPAALEGPDWHLLRESEHGLAKPVRAACEQWMKAWERPSDSGLGQLHVLEHASHCLPSAVAHPKAQLPRPQYTAFPLHICFHNP